jgi:hypothetical protein
MGPLNGGNGLGPYTASVPVGRCRQTPSKRNRHDRPDGQPRGDQRVAALLRARHTRASPGSGGDVGAWLEQKSRETTPDVWIHIDIPLVNAEQTTPCRTHRLPTARRAFLLPELGVGGRWLPHVHGTGNGNGWWSDPIRIRSVSNAHSNPKTFFRQAMATTGASRWVPPIDP